MADRRRKVLGFLSELGKAMLIPVAVLPVAGLLLRLGSADVWQGVFANGIPWMKAGGLAIFGNLPLIFAIGIAVGFADNNNGVAGIAATISYFVLTKVALTFNADIDMGVLAGIISGVLSGKLYNKYKAIKLPDFLGFFGGRRFVPIISSFYSLIIGVVAGLVYPPIQTAIDALGNAIISMGAAGSFLFGVINRLLIPFGLHRVFDNPFWFQFGQFTDATGNVIMGDRARFFAGDPTAGTFMTGFFPIMMFALPAACLAMITTAKKKNRKAVTGVLIGMAFTSFLTGVTEPVEFAFMFLAPVLYFAHAILTGVAMFVTEALGIKAGFTFSAGFIDYALNFGIITKPVLLLVVGVIFGLIYYVVFVFFIKKLDLPTPGRLDEDNSVKLAGLNSAQLIDKAREIIAAVGGVSNIDSIDACITRLRLDVIDDTQFDEEAVKKLGAAGVINVSKNKYQIIVGTVADVLATDIKTLMKSDTVT